MEDNKQADKSVTVSVGIMKRPALRFARKKWFVSGAVVILLVILSVGVGIGVRWLQDRNKRDAPNTVMGDSLPSSVSAAQNLALSGDEAQAQKNLSDTLSKTTEDSQKIELYLQQGVIYENSGKFDEALVAYRKAEVIDANFNVYSSIARAYEGKGDKVTALEYYKKALASIDYNRPTGTIDRDDTNQKIKELGG